MARLKPTLLVALAMGVVAVPAAAQFGSIFAPPRPPRDVPYPEYSTDDRLPVQPRYDRRQAPEPPPPPLTRLPSPPPNVQSQPLPPPPGTSVAVPPSQQPSVPQNPQDQQQASRPPATGIGQPPLMGLPPGQRQPRGTPGQGGPTTDEVVVAPPKQKIVNQAAVFAGLDKITGRIISFDVAIGETVQFGALRLTPRACYTRPPTDTPNTDGFVEVDEITLQGEVKRIFTGWMFAASPGLHGIEHSIYDVWLTDCKQPASQVAGVETPAEPAAAPPAPQPRQQPARAPRQQRAPAGGQGTVAQPTPQGNGVLLPPPPR